MVSGLTLSKAEKVWRPTQSLGGVVRCGPSPISVNTVPGLRAVHGFKANTQKSKNFYNVFAHFFHSDSTLTTIDPVVHGKKRRILSQVLSGNMIKKMEERILKHVRVFCDCMKGQYAQTISKSVDQKWSPAQSSSSWTSRLTFDIMGDLAFGRYFDMLKSDNNRLILDLLPNSVHGLRLVSARSRPQRDLALMLSVRLVSELTGRTHARITQAKA